MLFVCCWWWWWCWSWWWCRCCWRRWWWLRRVEVLCLGLYPVHLPSMLVKTTRIQPGGTEEMPRKRAETVQQARMFPTGKRRKIRTQSNGEIFWPPFSYEHSAIHNPVMHCLSPPPLPLSPQRTISTFPRSSSCWKGAPISRLEVTERSLRFCWRRKGAIWTRYGSSGRRGRPWKLRTTGRSRRCSSRARTTTARYLVNVGGPLLRERERSGRHDELPSLVLRALSPFDPPSPCPVQQQLS